jgi:hypothetical protein
MRRAIAVFVTALILVTATGWDQPAQSRRAGDGSIEVIAGDGNIEIIGG